jgi:hypothetical protein
VFLALPGSNAHLELTSGGSHDAPAPHPESLLVLYLGDHSAIAAVTARIEAEPVASANPYWAAHGLTLEDPDGFRVVLVPESFPQPGLPAGAVRVELHRGPRPELRALFALAEDSAAQLDSYLDYGHVLVGLEGDQIVGQLQLTDTALLGAAEIKNMASGVSRAATADRASSAAGSTWTDEMAGHTQHDGLSVSRRRAEGRAVLRFICVRRPERGGWTLHCPCAPSAYTPRHRTKPSHSRRWSRLPATLQRTCWRFSARSATAPLAA